MNRLWLCVSALTGVCLFVSACVYVADRPHRAAAGQYQHNVKGAVKAHLWDGSVIVSPKGLIARGRHFYFPPQPTAIHDRKLYLARRAMQYSLSRADSVAVDSVAVDSVAFLEYYRHALDVPMFISGLVLYNPYALAGMAVAIFGSCPTIYTHGETERLEAECFSYSMMPQMEGDDLDRLDYGREENGEYRLTLTNEAFETHYINELRLVTVDHDSGTEVFPTPQEDVAVFGRPSPLLTAHDFSGRDVTAPLQARDEVYFESDSSTVAALAADGGVRDGLELEVANPTRAKRMVVAFKLRATLMNTIFFYDKVLGSQGVDALNFMQPGFWKLFKTWRLSRWYTERFGLHLQTFDGTRYREVACVVNAGPIVWRQVAVEIPAPDEPVARLRLVSVPGNWAIDWIGVSFEATGAPKITELNAAEVQRLDEIPCADAARNIQKADKEYLVTIPGDAYSVTYKTPPPAAEKRRSYFVKSRGYYIEWLRQSWLAQAESDSAEPVFRMDDEVVRRTAATWLARRADFEREFFATRFSPARGARP